MTVGYAASSHQHSDKTVTLRERQVQRTELSLVEVVRVQKLARPPISEITMLTVELLDNPNTRALERRQFQRIMRDTGKDMEHKCKSS